MQPNHAFERTVNHRWRFVLAMDRVLAEAQWRWWPGRSTRSLKRTKMEPSQLARWLIAANVVEGAVVSAEALVRRARHFTRLAALCALVATSAPVTQAASPLRIGIVANTVPLAEWRGSTVSDGAPNAAAVITRGLIELGWVEGKNVQFVWRSAEGRFDRLPAIFEELVALPVDVIVAIGPGAVEAAKVTRTTPIVMAASAGAVNIGLAASLGRPATNVTGLSFEVSPALEGKKLALLKQSAPHVSRVAILSEGPEPAVIPKSIRDAANALGIKVLPVGFAALEEIEGAIASAANQGADALLVMDGVWVHRRSCQLIINTQAIRHKLPVMHTALGGAETGGLLAYGIDTLDQYRRIPYFIDRILRGARPADLPIEQPRTFTLALNLDTARVLGLTIPPTVIVQADRVIDASQSGRR